MKFEYLVLNQNIKNIGSTWVSLDEAGNYGWELVSITPVGSDIESAHAGRTDQVLLTFKRPLKNSSDESDSAPHSKATNSLLTSNSQADEASPEQEYALYLEAVGSEKIRLIKVIREIVPRIGLREAKELAEHPLPVLIRNGLTKRDALKYMCDIESIGYKASITFYKRDLNAFSGIICFRETLLIPNS